VADLGQAQLSAEAGHHEWACFASHQAAVKALKALHLHHGQQSWGHGLGRSFRDLPPAVATQLAAQVSDLEDRLRVPSAVMAAAPLPLAATLICCWWMPVPKALSICGCAIGPWSACR
jgi:HEPN domain-containing protein